MQLISGIIYFQVVRFTDFPQIPGQFTNKILFCKEIAYRYQQFNFILNYKNFQTAS